MGKKRKEHIAMLTVPCSRALVVAPEKAQEFKNHKPNPEIRRQMNEMVKEFRINNLVSEGPVLKKIRKYNK